MRLVATFLLTLVLGACGGDALERNLQQAAAHIHAGEVAAAREELGQALQLDPGSAEGRFLLGKLHFVTDASALAAQELARAEELGWPPDYTRPLIARSWLAEGQTGRVLALSAQGLSPAGSARLLSVQALAALLAGEEDLAGELAEGARRSAPDDIEVRLLPARMAALRHRYGAALATTDAVLAELPGNVEATCLRARILLRQDRPVAARDAFSAAIAATALDFSDRVARATLNLRLGEPDAVDADLERLQVLAPGHPSVKYLTGLMAFHAGDDDRAVFNLEAARPVSGRYPLVLFYLALAHLFESDASVAENLAREFVALAPDSIRGRKLLAALALHNGHYDAVEAVLQPVLDFNPDDTGALALLAQALLYLDRADQSLALLLHLSEVAPALPVGEMPLTAGVLDTPLDEPRAAQVEAALARPTGLPRDDVLQIHSLVRAGDYPGALAVAESLRWRDTAGIAPYNLQAVLHLMAGQPAAAREVLERALRREPGNPSANLALGGLARKAGRARAERARYFAVLRVDPAHVPALLAMADLEGREGDLNAMRGNLQEAIDRNPQALAPRLALAQYFLDRDRPQRVLSMFTDLQGLQQRAPRAVELVARAELATGRARDAYAALSDSLRSAGGTAAQYQLLAAAALACGERTAAAAAIDRALALAPDYLPALLLRANLQDMAGDGEGLARTLARLGKPAADQPEVQRLQAALLALQGQVAPALRRTRTLYREAPSSALAVQMARLQWALGNTDRAGETLRNWLKTHPDDVLVRLSLADQLYRAQRPGAARRQYERVLQQDPEQVLALNNLAWLLRESDPARALAYGRRAAGLRPRDPAVLDTLALVEHANGRHRQAAGTIERALQEAPDNPGMRYHQAIISAALGREQAARRQLRALLQPGAEPFAEQAQARALLARLARPADG